jgi:hypothetical protein
VAESTRDDLAEIIIPAAQSGRGATNPGGPVSPDDQAVSSGVSSQTHVELTKAIAETAAIPQWRAALAASFLLDEEGWRPPLLDTLSPWDAYREAYNEFRRDVPTWRAHFTAHHLHALEAALRVYDPCVDHRETEWGCLDQHGQVHSVGVENEAQARAMRSMTPVRREVGPWTEVQP